ncbi:MULTISPECIES: stage II sporulation protein R [unclassified Ruminococcus]|uniref:stage II sporulation protein R n=1 Tax=unclassified Ruminococcus TaxID=2608920 RepID=UPI0021099133|nr:MULTISPECIES: stage II sporulation protein R [unclassified Ruminococcus]MCQ4022664.1 stage II sporulation protein R [Ruminococcus sp. zg-924]MCQ4114904.1 stage II sporulation protein R [Ruminococcus sp. zg-921]
MRKFFTSHFFSKVVITLFVFCLLSSCVQFSAQCSEISDKVLRLHILANSDSEADQQLKLKLRDRLLENSQELLGQPLSKNDAIFCAQSKIGDIEKFCNTEFQRMGSGYKAHCEVINMYFNTRTYGSSTMPAGFYDALRITIGKGEGRNWWCVLFPPICLSGAVEEQEVFSADDENILNNEQEYEFQFKVVEVFDYIKSLF